MNPKSLKRNPLAEELCRLTCERDNARSDMNKARATIENQAAMMSNFSRELNAATKHAGELTDKLRTAIEEIEFLRKIIKSLTRNP